MMPSLSVTLMLLSWRSIRTGGSTLSGQISTGEKSCTQRHRNSHTFTCASNSSRVNLPLRSMKMCQLTYRFPILLDASTAAIMRKGDKFLARWADIMTGRVPKVHLLHPEFVIVITFEIILILFRRLIGVNAGRKNGVSTSLTSSKDK